jgi:DNA replication and repair protein RecF
VNLKSLYLRNFRNIREMEVSFDPYLNVISGDNAQGKTNLLEAIFFLSTGKSFRTQHLSDLICEKESFFYLEGEIIHNNISLTIKVSFDGENKKLQLGATSYSNFQPLLGTLPLILHAPNDLELICGPPNLRRRFLNLHLAQSDPLYIHHLIRYSQAMKQRNCLLRLKKEEPIECWEQEMAHSAFYLHQMRFQFIETLKPLMSSVSTELSLTKEVHELQYLPSFSDRYLELLKKNRPREKELGVTLMGPHRDELSFWIDGKSMRIFGSEGQKKTALASLRLAEWKRLSSAIKEVPILAIDELGLPLDEIRQGLVWEKVGHLGQVFVTTATPSKELSRFHKIMIAGGCLRGG